jgi:hypothetical protein
VISLAAVALFPEAWAWVLRQSTHPLAQAILWASGAAVFSMLVVLGCWYWHRSALRGLMLQAQRYVAGWLAVRAEAPATHGRHGRRIRPSQAALRCRSRSGFQGRRPEGLGRNRLLEDDRGLN